MPLDGGNKCAFCRNHGIDIPVKNHKNKCPYNNKKHFKKCKECKQNWKKIENARNYRLRKSKNQPCPKSENQIIDEENDIPIDEAPSLHFSEESHLIGMKMFFNC